MDALIDLNARPAHEDTNEVAAQAGSATLDELFPGVGRIVVVAPHPDDETLGCGGILSMLAAAGREIVLVAVTDGEACYPAASNSRKRIIAIRRRYESQFALLRLGINSARHVRLGIADGAIDAHRERLASSLGAILRDGDSVITTWRGDGHPDHEATGAIAAQCAAASGAILREVPIWMWSWARPLDSRVPWQRARRLVLAADAQRRKRHAVAAYGSQLRAPDDIGGDPILADTMLQRWLGSFELVFQ